MSTTRTDVAAVAADATDRGLGGGQRRWLEEYPAADVGVEGLVAKGSGQRYLPGRRAWVKVRIHNTQEATAGAVIGPVERPDWLILGLRTAAGEFRVAGATHPLTAQQAA